MDSIAQVNYVEIDEQSNWFSAQLQIRDDLRLEDWMQRLAAVMIAPVSWLMGGIDHWTTEDAEVRRGNALGCVYFRGWVSGRSDESESSTCCWEAMLGFFFL